MCLLSASVYPVSEVPRFWPIYLQAVSCRRRGGKRSKLSLCSDSNLCASASFSDVVHAASTLYREHCWKEANIVKPSDASFNHYFWLRDRQPGKRTGGCDPAFPSIPICRGVLLLLARVHTGEQKRRANCSAFLTVLWLLLLGWLLRTAL